MPGALASRSSQQFPAVSRPSTRFSQRVKGLGHAQPSSCCCIACWGEDLVRLVSKPIIDEEGQTCDIMSDESSTLMEKKTSDTLGRHHAAALHIRGGPCDEKDQYLLFPTRAVRQWIIGLGHRGPPLCGCIACRVEDLITRRRDS